MEYLDFELEVNQAGEGKYLVSVNHSPAGTGSEPISYPFDPDSLQTYLGQLEHALLRSAANFRRQNDLRPVIDFGKRLFNALFVDEVRHLYYESHRIVEREDKGLRLRLRMNAPELATLPWELLYDSRQLEFICLSRNTPFVRYPEVPKPSEPLRVHLPLRILGMAVNVNGQRKLDIEQEKNRLNQALSSLVDRGLVTITWLEGHGWRDLQRAMRNGPWHIFHFIGHGGYDEYNDEGYLELANEDGSVYRMMGNNLAQLLADHRPLRLALLNACQGAKNSQRDTLSGLGAFLVRRGVPAVLAMQYEFSDPAAIELSQAFYEALAEGLPVDQAVAEARLAINNALSGTIEWVTPVLYMRSTDGLLFNLQDTTGADTSLPVRPDLPVRIALESPVQPIRDTVKLLLACPIMSNPGGRQSVVAQLPGTIRHSFGLAAQISPIQEVTMLVSACFNYPKGLAILLEAVEFFESDSLPYQALERYVKTLTVPFSTPVTVTHTQPVQTISSALAYTTRSAVLTPVVDKVQLERLLKEGNDHANRQAYSLAVSAYTRVLELDPAQAEAYSSRGSVYYYLKQYERASEDCSKAIKLDPDYAEAYNNRANVYADLKQYERAIADYNKALELDPTCEVFYLNRGNTYYYLKQYERAIQDYTRAIKIDPQNPVFYYSRGNVYTELKQYQPAVYDYNRALDLDPSHAEAYINRGSAYNELQQYDRAIADCTRALDLRPDDPAAYLNRCYSYNKLGKFSSAREDFARAKELSYTAKRSFLTWLKHT